jgi:hypothetical protein
MNAVSIADEPDNPTCRGMFVCTVAMNGLIAGLNRF